MPELPEKSIWDWMVSPARDMTVMAPGTCKCELYLRVIFADVAKVMILRIWSGSLTVNVLYKIEWSGGEVTYHGQEME